MPFDLHLQMQERYAGDTGQCEAQIGTFRADVLRDGVIYEIQTRNLRSIRGKICGLLDDWPVVIVFPVAVSTVFVYCDGDPLEEVRRRTSPKRGTPLDAFEEMVSLASVLAHCNLSVEIPLVTVEEMRRRRTEQEIARMRKRRKRRRNSVPEWETVNRRITGFEDVLRLDIPSDGLRFIPEDVPERFTSKMLGEAVGLVAWKARRITYTLRHLGTIVQHERTKDGYWYTRADA